MELDWGTCQGRFQAHLHGKSRSTLRLDCDGATKASRCRVRSRCELSQVLCHLPGRRGGGGRGERRASPPILCHHHMLLVVVMWLVAGWEPAAEPGPGPEESLLATVAAVASLPWPQSRREKLRVTCFLYSSSCSPSFYLGEGRKLLWGSTDPLPHSLPLPSVPGCNPTASACLSVLTSRLFWHLFSTQTCGT